MSSKAVKREAFTGADELQLTCPCLRVFSEVPGLNNLRLCGACVGSPRTGNEELGCYSPDCYNCHGPGRMVVCPTCNGEGYVGEVALRLEVALMSEGKYDAPEGVERNWEWP